MSTLFIYPLSTPQEDGLWDMLSLKRPSVIAQCAQAAYPDNNLIFATPNRNDTIAGFSRDVYSYICLPDQAPYSLECLSTWISEHSINKLILWWEPALWCHNKYHFKIPSVVLLATPSDQVWEHQIPFLDSFTTIMCTSVTVQHQLQQYLPNQTIENFCIGVDLATGENVNSKPDSSSWNLLVVLPKPILSDLNQTLITLKLFTDKVLTNDKFCRRPISIHLCYSKYDYTPYDIRLHLYQHDLTNVKVVINDSIPIDERELQRYQCLLYCPLGESTGEYLFTCQTYGIPVVTNQFGLLSDFAFLATARDPAIKTQVRLDLACTVSQLSPVQLSDALLQIYHFNSVETVCHASSQKALSMCISNRTNANSRIIQVLLDLQTKQEITVCFLTYSDSVQAETDTKKNNLVLDNYCKNHDYKYLENNECTNNLLERVKQLSKDFSYLVVLHKNTIPVYHDFDVKEFVQYHNFDTSNKCVLSSYQKQGEWDKLFTFEKKNLLTIWKNTEKLQSSESIQRLYKDCQWMYHNFLKSVTLQPQTQSWHSHSFWAYADQTELGYQVTAELPAWHFIYHVLTLPDIGRVTLLPYGKLRIKDLEGQWYYQETRDQNYLINIVYLYQDQLLALEVTVPNKSSWR